jgi:hypothetical protein
VPAPITRAVEPGEGEARFRLCIATERGSRRAAASKETVSGILRPFRSGQLLFNFGA